MQLVAEEYLQSLRDRIERTNALGRMSTWLPKHTKLGDYAFDFLGHEFQIAIADETHPDCCVIKPSQVGLTELTLRILLGFLATGNSITALYSMPTEKEALRNSKSRIDPIIVSSLYLKSILMTGSDSASFKQLGSSQLFVIGTWGKPVISLPVDLVVNDEVDFSNAEVLKTTESRLSHSRFYDPVLDIRGIRRRFSTPTIPGMGISADFDASDRRVRMVKCKHCGSWFWPEFLKHVVVDGWDAPMDELLDSDVENLESRGLAQTARLLCPTCHEVITKSNLGSEYRDWVAEKPSVVRKRGYHVSPFDLPDYHTPASLLMKKLFYKGEERHWRNFSLGVSYADASNGIVDETVQANSFLRPIYPDSASCYGAVMGVDVGKVSHVLVGVPVQGVLEVVWGQTIILRGSDDLTLLNTLADLVRKFKVLKLCIDALPYSDTVLALQALFPAGLVWANSYDLQDRKLPMYLTDERTYTIKSNRTKTLDSASKRVNSGRARFAKFPDHTLMCQHFQGLKRVDSMDDEGNWSGNWVRSSQDHYFHALNYLNIAADMVEDGLITEWAPMPGVREAEIGRIQQLREAEKERYS